MITINKESTEKTFKDLALYEYFLIKSHGDEDDNINFQDNEIRYYMKVHTGAFYRAIEISKNGNMDLVIVNENETVIPVKIESFEVVLKFR